MSVTIRLARIGKKNAPAFKIVVANTTDKRNGKYLQVLGHYNPSTKPVAYKLDEESYEKWVSNGALVSDAVKKLKEGTYVFVPYEPHKKVSSDDELALQVEEEATEASVENSEEAPAEEAVAEEEKESEEA